MKITMFFLVICLLFSCDRRAKLQISRADHGENMEMMAIKSHTAEEQTPSDRKLIRRGFLNLVVVEVGKTKTEIQKICKEFSAYTSSETQTTYDERLEYSQVIRVPAAHFDVLVQKIEALGSQVKNKNIETSDVTEEFIDKEARIKTKKELENRYREILKQAKLVSDILSIEAQLNQVRADIESMEGRLNFLRNQVAFSTLSLSFYEPVGAQFGFGSKTVAAFGNGWDMLLIFIIGILNLWPFLIIISAILFFILRRSRINRNLREVKAAD